MNCLFCKIIRGEIPATITYQDDHIIAFNDIYPKAPIHQLIVPKQHIATLNDVVTEDLPLISNTFFVAQQIAKKMQLTEEGYRLIINCNAGGGQEIFHLHVHFLGKLHRQI